MPELGPLTKELLGGETKGDPLGPLTRELLSGETSTTASAAPQEKGMVQNIGGGLKQGVLDVAGTLDTGRAKLTDFIATKLFGVPTEGAYTKESAEGNKRIQEQYEKEYGDSTAAAISRVGGQIVATAPLAPEAAAIKGAMNALPIVTQTGTKIAAPILNRLGANMAIGAVGGGTFGGLTSGTNEDSLTSNVGSGVITGAIANPIVAGAGAVGAKVLPTLRNLWANANIQKIAFSSGLPANSVKNIIGRLEDAGLTPQEAQVALNKMGPQATIADLDAALSAEAGGLAQFGGKPTTILKERYLAREGAANSNANQIMESKLGTRPDLEVERTSIVNQARSLTKSDYDYAHNTPQKLDVSNVVSSIDNVLTSAVGKEASELAKAKSYLVRPDGTLKGDVTSLHKVRQALDDRLSELPKEGTSQQTATYRALNNVREMVDAKLKAIPEMKAADEKFAEKMQIANHLQLGYDALTKKMNVQNFDKLWDNASLEQKQALQKGIRAAIGDYMETSMRGELSEAQRLFGKKSVNRHIMEKVFGQNGTEVLDALKDEAAKKYTEKHVLHQSTTALNTAIRERYQNAPSGGIISEAIKGLAVDVSTGSTAGAATVMAGRKILGNRLINFSENKLQNLAEGSADLISRQGAQRDTGLDILSRVKKVQDNLKVKNRLENYISKGSIPSTAASPLGEKLKQEYKERF